MDRDTIDLVERRREELATCRRRATEATNTQNQRVWKAQAAVKQAVREHERRVKNLEDAVSSSYAAPSALECTVGQLRVFGDRVEMGKESVALGADSQAWVEVSGGVYTTSSTRTRAGVSIPGAIVGGMIAGPVGVVVGGHKTKHETVNTVHDDRALYFEVRGSAGNASWQLPADKEADARKAAAKVADLARTLEYRRESAAQSAVRYGNELAEAKADRGAIVDAQRALDVVKADNGIELACMDEYGRRKQEFDALVAATNASAVAAGEKEPFKSDGTLRLGVDKDHDRPYKIAAVVVAVLLILSLIAYYA